MTPLVCTWFSFLFLYLLSYKAQQVSVTHLQSNVDKLLSTQLNGLVVLGSNGEFPLLNAHEKLLVLYIFN